MNHTNPVRLLALYTALASNAHIEDVHTECTKKINVQFVLLYPHFLFTHNIDFNSTTHVHRIHYNSFYRKCSILLPLWSIQCWQQWDINLQTSTYILFGVAAHPRSIAVLSFSSVALFLVYKLSKGQLALGLENGQYLTRRFLSNPCVWKTLTDTCSYIMMMVYRCSPPFWKIRLSIFAQHFATLPDPCRWLREAALVTVFKEK